MKRVIVSLLIVIAMLTAGFSVGHFSMTSDVYAWGSGGGDDEGGNGADDGSDNDVDGGDDDGGGGDSGDDGGDDGGE